MASASKIRGLIRELESIEKECLPQGQINPGAVDGGVSVSPFEAAKESLVLTLQELDEGVAERTRVLEEQGRGQKAIELRHLNQKLLEKAKHDYEDLKRIHAKEVGKTGFIKSKYTAEELARWEEFMGIFAEKINAIETEHMSRANKGKRNDAARRMQAERAERNANGGGAARGGGGQASEQTQAFLNQVQEHDQKFDLMAAEILSGVQKLRAQAEDINVELDVQDKQIEELDEVMDMVENKFIRNNKQMKELLEKTGGSANWCFRITLFVVFMGLIAYMLNIF